MGLRTAAPHLVPGRLDRTARPHRRAAAPAGLRPVAASPAPSAPTRPHQPHHPLAPVRAGGRTTSAGPAPPATSPRPTWSGSASTRGPPSLQSIRPTVTFDFRDNATHPHRGWFATGSAELAHSLGASGETLPGLLPGQRHLQQPGQAAGHAHRLPAGERRTPCWPSRPAAGRSSRSIPASRTIVPQALLHGRRRSLRGFAEEEMIRRTCAASWRAEGRALRHLAHRRRLHRARPPLADGSTPVVSEGGEAFLLLKGELRLRWPAGVELGLFVDLGNLWLDPKRTRLLRPAPQRRRGRPLRHAGRSGGARPGLQPRPRRPDQRAPSSRPTSPSGSSDRLTRPTSAPPSTAQP